jgi:RNA polymerase sigma-70 factor (ECF subfamily)
MTASRAQEDRQLVTAFLDGDHAAFDEIMTAHEGRVFSLCLRIMRQREAALDAVQETFITVFRKAHMYNGESAFSTWLYRVATNTCYDQLRKQKRRRTEAVPEGRDPADARSQDEFVAIELRPDLTVALANLPEEFRSAVVLSDVEGLPLGEVAVVLDIPIGTVKSRVFRGRKLLAKNLRNFCGDPKRQNNNA